MIDLLVDTSANTVDLQEHSTDLSVLTDFQRSIHLTLYSRRSFSSGRFREEASIFDIDFSSHRSTASIYLLLNQWNTCEHHVNICHWVRLGLLSYC